MVLFIAILLLFFYAILGYKKPAVALITLPAVLFVFAFAVCAEAGEAAIISPVIFIITLIAVLISKDESAIETWPQALAKWILISIVLFPLFMVVFILLGMGGFIGFGFFVLFIISVIAYHITSRYATAAYVISTIGSSMRQNLPLPMALESAASGRKDKRSRILRAIKKWLVQGYSLSESVKRGYPRCPGYVLATMAAAEKIDQLPQAMTSLEADMTAKSNERKRLQPVHPAYPVILITFMFLIAYVLLWKIVPTFSAVLIDITGGAPLPGALRLLITISRVLFRPFANEYALLTSVVIGLGFIVAVISYIRFRLRPRRPQKPYLFSRTGDFIKWHLPILHWFERNFSMVRAAELLRLSLNAGCTVNDAIAQCIDLDVNNCFRKQLKKWLAKVEAGENISTAARDSGLASSLAWAFDQQVNPGSTLTVLEMLESSYRTNYSYRVNLARFIMWPCIVITMGLMVGFVIYAFYSPMVLIINRLAELVYS